MRESVKRKQQKQRQKARVILKRRLLWLSVPFAIVSTLLFIIVGGIIADEVVRDIERDRDLRIVESQVRAVKLQQKRIEERKAENTGIRSMIYEDVVAGSLDPPDFDSNRCNYLTTHGNPEMLDVMVNKRNCINPIDFRPETVLIYGVTLEPETAEAFRDLIQASTIAGHDIRATSGYRTYQDQAMLYLTRHSTFGKDDADSHSAYPGYSEHQTGLAVDVMTPGCALDCFGTTAAYSWMTDNAHKFGFIERYPEDHHETTGYKFEPWHWRYVGVPAASALRDSKHKTLETYWAIPG